ncbi:CAP-Gly domain-containing linker protein 1 [Microdochium nivale]|nr:CAP-Gly domain-containing linker protein 1 [Microdochium nivale]
MLSDTEDSAQREIQRQQTELSQLRIKVTELRNENQELNRQVTEYADNWDGCVDEKQLAIAGHETATRQVHMLEEKLRRADKDFDGISQEMKDQSDRLEKAEDNARQTMSTFVQTQAELLASMELEIAKLQEQTRLKDDSIRHLVSQVSDLQHLAVVPGSTTNTPDISPNTTITQTHIVPHEDGRRVTSLGRPRINRRPGISLFTELESIYAGSFGEGCNFANEESNGDTVCESFGTSPHDEMQAGSLDHNCDAAAQADDIESLPDSMGLCRSRSIGSSWSLSTSDDNSGTGPLSDAGDFSREVRLLSSPLSPPDEKLPMEHCIKPIPINWTGPAESRHAPLLEAWHSQQDAEESGQAPAATSKDRLVQAAKPPQIRRWVIGKGQWVWAGHCLLIFALVMICLAEGAQYQAWRSANGVSRAMYVSAETEQWCFRMPSAGAAWDLLSSNGLPGRPSRWP